MPDAGIEQPITALLKEIDELGELPRTDALDRRIETLRRRIDTVRAGLSRLTPWQRVWSPGIPSVPASRTSSGCCSRALWRFTAIAGSPTTTPS
jgi:hypothetical protein